MQFGVCSEYNPLTMCMFLFEIVFSFFRYKFVSLTSLEL